MVVECSICSLISFLFGCVYNLVACALQYPSVVFMISFGIAIIIMSNIQTARMLCSLGGCTTTTVCEDGAGTPNFDYGPERGPHTWQVSDANQSPINIVDDYVQKLPIRELLTWNHYEDLPSGIMLENNGNTVTLRACYNGNTPTVSGADLLASYTFVELCFRWSAINSEGSEHMLNYRKYPLEMQAMHRTGPVGGTTSSYDLLMIAYFFEISTNNICLDPLVQHLHRIRKPNTKVEIPPFPLSYLCHQFRTGFYSYGGSLTEPPCLQGAEWFVFPEPMAISERQLNEFRSLLSSDGKNRIIRNYRPVQNLNCSRMVNLNQYNPCDATQIDAPLCEEQCEDDEGFE